MLRCVLLGLVVLSVCALAQETEEKVEAKKKSNPNPCASHHCAHGYECDVDEEGVPSCVCLKTCSKPVPGEEVCSTHNETFASECELDRQRCLCHHEKLNCTKPEYKHAHLDYYGYCRTFPECSEAQMGTFPVRMRNWLKLVLQELAKRKDISAQEIKLAEQSRKEGASAKIPVLWKFCDLDRHPYDGEVTRRELLVITAQLKTMEHCMAPFLDKCAGDDKIITLKEWSTCLGMSDDEVADFNDMCEELHKK